MRLTSIIILFLKYFNLLGSEVMKLYLRLNGAKIEKKVFLSFSSRLVSKNIIILKDSVILERVKIKAKSIKIGKSCIISSDVFISGKENISIGNKTYLGKKVRIDLNRNVTIGEDVGLGENSVIWTHGYFPPADEGYPVTYAPVIIKDKAWVSTNIILLPGVTVGEKVIIGAGSVVTKSIEDLKVAAGNPARVIKTVDEILLKKSFITIMSEIINTFEPENLINKSENTDKSVYNYNNYTIIITENYIPQEFNSFKNKIIILSKGISHDQIAKNKNIYIFDFNSKEILRTSNQIILNIKDYLVGFGIRFTYID